MQTTNMLMYTLKTFVLTLPFKLLHCLDLQLYIYTTYKLNNYHFPEMKRDLYMDDRL